MERNHCKIWTIWNPLLNGSDAFSLTIIHVSTQSPCEHQHPGVGTHSIIGVFQNSAIYLQLPIALTHPQYISHGWQDHWISLWKQGHEKFVGGGCQT